MVHVRNLHQKVIKPKTNKNYFIYFQVTEADLLEALSNFGPVAYATCIPHSRMALVEFEDIEGAKACVNFATSNQINVGGQVKINRNLFVTSIMNYQKIISLNSFVIDNFSIFLRFLFKNTVCQISEISFAKINVKL